MSRKTVKPMESGLTVSEISAKLLLDSGTLTPILQKLDQNALITRTRSPRDDRRVLNALTEKGRLLRVQALEMSYHLFCASGLTIEQIESLKAAVKNLVGKVQCHLENSKQ
jgi:DNA-binding MarR family transcriptional regulator